MGKKTTPKIPLRVLCLEDEPRDAEIMRELLASAGFDLKVDCTEVEKEFVSLLHSNTYDIILSDFKLPGFDGFTALRLSVEICPHIPFICVSGTIGEEAAVELLKQGAVDYVLKDRLARLPAAIRRALDEAREKESRRRAEEALSESERKLNEAQKMAQLGNWIWDVRTGNVEWSEEVFKIFQLNPKAFTPQIDSILSLSPWPEDHERDKELIRRAMESQEKGSYEQRFLRPDKSVGYYYSTFQGKYDDGGNLILIVGTVQDITERKQAEEILRESESRTKAMFQAIPDMIFRLDRHGIFLDYKADVKDLYAQSVPNIIGKRNRDLTPPEFADLIDRKIHTTLMTNTLQTFEYQLPVLGGGEKNFEARMVMSGVDEVTAIVRDITERKRTEEELKKSEEKYRSVFENVQDVYYESLIDGTILEISPSIELISEGQYHRADLIGMSMSEFYADAKDRDTIIKMLQETGRVADFEVQLKNRDCSLIFCSVSAKLSFNDEGQPEKIIGSMHNISKRKRAEAALRESEERFRSIYENSTIGLYRTTPDGKIILANPTLIKMLGYSNFEELALRNFEQDGFEPSYERKQFTEQIELNGEVKGLESAWTRKDGSTVYIRESARAICNSNGKILYYDGNVEDITERKQAEEALNSEQNLLRSLMDNVPDHIYFKDLNSRFLRLSRSQAERFGLSDPAQAIGKTDFDFFTEDHARPAYKHEQEVIKTNIPLVNIEEKETWPGGQETWVSTTKVPLHDLNGHIIGTFGISRDITEQKKLQSQLMQTQKVQSIGTLAGGIAHDFNNILGIILAYTSVLERSEGDKEKVTKSTTAITQAVGRGAALVRQILTFARQTGAMVKPILIPELVREIVDMLKETFPELIEFKTTIEKNVPFINADQSQMHQVLLNLCVNARDALPNGGVITIEVKTVASETLVKQFPEAKNDRYIFLSISDTGTGMDEATRSRIFDPFFTTKEQGKGTGLGLSVVHGVIQDHHGFISVDSKVGHGTTFHLYIPVPREEKKITEIKDTKGAELRRGSETILFVEDEELLREVVQSTLEANGYKVILATNGREAVDIYKKQYKDIALVLSDMGLPKLGGIEVYAMFKEINPNIKIIFASGFVSLETRSALLKEGAQGFIMKPYSIHEVLHMVREVLDNKGENNEQHNFSN